VDAEIEAEMAGKKNTLGNVVRRDVEPTAASRIKRNLNSVTASRCITRVMYKKKSYNTRQQEVIVQIAIANKKKDG